MKKNEDKEFEAALKKSMLSNKGKIDGSAMFVSLYSDGMYKDPLACLQLGMAIMMDKPIVLIGLQGAKLPEHLKKIATFVDEVDSVEDASGAIVKALSLIPKENDLQ